MVPAGEPFKAHISNVEVTKDKNFDNPEILEDKLVIRYTLDSDIEGRGQVYTGWYKPSVNPKSKLYKLLVAVYGGNIPSPLDVTDLAGKPLRIILTEPVEKNGKTRQYVEAYLKPTADQPVIAQTQAAPSQDLDDVLADAMKILEG